MEIANRVAFVTGGGSGLGAATARALAAAGARVAIFDRDTTKGQAVADGIGGRSFACDVADAISAERAIADAAEALGTPAALVNCAGIGTAARIVGRDGPMPLGEREAIAVALLQQGGKLGGFHAFCFSLQLMQTRVQGIAFSRASAIMLPQSRQTP